MNNQRRYFLKALASSTLVTATLVGCKSAPLLNVFEAPISADDWQMAAQIKSAIVVPTFPAKQFNIKDFGAKENGQYDCTQAINIAI